MSDRHADEPNALMIRIAGGDRTALATLFQGHAGRLIAIAQRIVRRRELAEEVVQDAFVAAWQRAKQFDPARGNAIAWLTIIVRNRAINLLRDGARMDLHDEAGLATIADGSAEAQRAFDALVEGGALRSCLGNLDELKRRAIVLSYVNGFNHGEVAALLNAPLGTVKAWIRRGVIALQECLA